MRVIKKANIAWKKISHNPLVPENFIFYTSLMISVGFIQDKYFSIENLFNKFEIERVSPPIL